MRRTSSSTRRSAQFGQRHARCFDGRVEERPSELTYDAIETLIANLTAERNVLAGQIRTALNDAAAGNGSIDKGQARSWIKQANDLLDRAQTLAAGATGRRRSTSEGSSSRHAPGSSPLSVSGP